MCDKSHCTGRRRAIVFSLYGSEVKYTHGAVENARIVRDLFPDYECWIYVPEGDGRTSVPSRIIERLRANGAHVLWVDNATVARVGFGMSQQRFLVAALPELEVFFIRDADSRLLLRDRWAEDEWEESGKAFHILYDHPLHWAPGAKPILGGMWGGHGGSIPNMSGLLEAYAQLRSSRIPGQSPLVAYMDDMRFLEDVVWPIMLRDGVFIHSSVGCDRKDVNVTSYMYPRAGGEHIGGYFAADNVISPGGAKEVSSNPQTAACSVRKRVSAAQRVKLSIDAINACADVGLPRARTGHEDGPTIMAFSAPQGLSQCSRAECELELGRWRATALAEMLHPLPTSKRDFARIAVLGGVAAPTLSAIETGARTRNNFATLFVWERVFVDHVRAACATHAAFAGLPPSIFDNERTFVWNATAATARCAAAASAQALAEVANAAQYHERIGWAKSHYDLVPGGVRYKPEIAVLQAMYCGTVSCVLMHALPQVMWLLARGPRNVTILVPQNPELTAVLDALFVTHLLPSFLAHPGRAGQLVPPLNISKWNQIPNLLRHEDEPALYWAHRLFVIADTALAGYDMLSWKASPCKNDGPEERGCSTAFEAIEMQSIALSTSTMRGRAVTDLNNVVAIDSSLQHWAEESGSGTALLEALAEQGLRHVFIPQRPDVSTVPAVAGLSRALAYLVSADYFSAGLWLVPRPARVVLLAHTPAAGAAGGTEHHAATAVSPAVRSACARFFQSPDRCVLITTSVVDVDAKAFRGATRSAKANVTLSAETKRFVRAFFEASNVLAHLQV